MITVSRHIDAPPGRVWSVLADLSAHGEWMSDAGRVEFLGEERVGLGVRMRVPTTVGPWRTADLLVVVEWEEGRAIGVEHTGAVSGTGRFELVPSEGGALLTWTERLRLPWWMGGPVGGWLARPVLARIWRGNLARLEARVLSGPETPPPASR